MLSLLWVIIMAKFIMSISVVPVGTESTSLSKFVASVLKAFKENNIKFQLTPMNTVVYSDDIDDILKAIKTAHDAIIKEGIKRVVIAVNIDARHDKERSPEDKVKAVMEKLEESD